MSQEVTTSRVFAVIPAAGRSSRMGEPKLLMPWNGRRVIDCVCEAWTRSRVDEVVVVCRASDRELIAACREWQVSPVCPDVDPSDMKASIQAGLRYLNEQFAPKATEHWMTAPADLPNLRAQIIDRLIEEKRELTTTVPRFAGHESHPVLLPWSLVDDVYGLAENEGLKNLIERQSRAFVDFPKSSYASDIDTPEDYRQLKEEQG